jgi:hypothetical protein
VWPCTIGEKENGHGISPSNNRCGCPVGYIKEIFGLERLETTCRYSLGLDHRAAKAAHQQFLVSRTTGMPESDKVALSIHSHCAP